MNSKARSGSLQDEEMAMPQPPPKPKSLSIADFTPAEDTTGR